MIKKVLLTILLGIVLTVPAYATTYHVRKDGSDSSCNGMYNASSSSAPNCAKFTIQGGVNLATTAGDIVSVHAGDYSGSVPSFVSAYAGSLGNLITIQAAGDGAAYISRATLSHNYNKINGFAVTESGYLNTPGIYLTGSNCVASGNIINGTGRDDNTGITSTGSNNTMTGNTLQGSKTPATSFVRCIYSEGENATITYNLIKNLDTVGRVFEVYNTGAVIRKNEVHSIITTASGGDDHVDIFQIVSSVTSSVLVEQNYFHDIEGHVGNMWPDGGTQTWTFRNNIFANIGGSIYLHSPSNWYNNLFYRVSTWNTWVLTVYPGGENLVAKNNAFVGCGEGDGQNNGWYQQADEADNNFVSTVSGGAKSGFTGESNGVNGGTLGFTAAYSDCVSNTCNFAITSSSSLREEGATISSFSTDYAGTSRPQSTYWDIGPHEFSASGGDTTPPNVTEFTIPETSTSLTVSITTFTATDNVGVTGYLLTESSSTPSPSDPNWTSSAWTSYTFSSSGTKTLYAWAKDAAGNISSSLNDSVIITLEGSGVTGVGVSLR